MLSPRLKADLSIQSKSSFPGNRAQISIYPGKNRMKGKPSMMRAGESGKKAIAAISKAESEFTKIISRSVLKVRACIAVVFVVIVILLISFYTAPPQHHK